MSCVGFIASAPAAGADPQITPVSLAAVADENPQRRTAAGVDSDRARDDDIIVTGEMERTVESPKATRPLLDTPQTITVIGDQTIRKQNFLTLRDVLTTIPGITFGAGEGGGGYGDSINLRGYSANNDVTIDGVRDSAQYSRGEWPRPRSARARCAASAGRPIASPNGPSRSRTARMDRNR